MNEENNMTLSSDKK